MMGKYIDTWLNVEVDAKRYDEKIYIAHYDVEDRPPLDDYITSVSDVDGFIRPYSFEILPTIINYNLILRLPGRSVIPIQSENICFSKRLTKYYESYILRCITRDISSDYDGTLPFIMDKYLNKYRPVFDGNYVVTINGKKSVFTENGFKYRFIKPEEPVNKSIQTSDHIQTLTDNKADQKESPRLSESSNITILLELKRRCEAICAAQTFKLSDIMDISPLTMTESELFANYNIHDIIGIMYLKAKDKKNNE